MTDEEYQEQERLISQINSLSSQIERAENTRDQLEIDLELSISAMIAAASAAVTVHKAFMPVMDYTLAEVTEVNEMLLDVKAALADLIKNYITIKNMSTATKELTKLDDEYQRKFRLYEKFRKVCMGYVVGIDSYIISNESLRTLLEKNYLANSDYWIAHCIMATMLWVSDEKEAAYRAVKQAMEINKSKAVLFFLLVNLRFGRVDAAKEWYDLYAQELDVNDIGEEWQYLLQAYLYKAFGHDEEFEQKINKEFAGWIDEIKKYTINYDDKVLKKVTAFAEAFPHRTRFDSELLNRHCLDYEDLLTGLTKAEKISEIAKYYNDVYESTSSVNGKLSRKIEDILHNLIDAYDAEEMEIMKKVSYNEYVIKARGDIQLAKKMYDEQYANADQKQSLADLIFKFAFADIRENVDASVRKFAITLLLDVVEKGYANYRAIYNERYNKTEARFNLDGCEFTGSEKTIDKCRDTMKDYYKKNKHKFIRADKKFKVLLTFSIIFAVLVAGVTALAIVYTINSTKIPVFLWIIYGLLIAGLLIFSICAGFRKKKVIENIKRREKENLIKLNQIMKELERYHEEYKAADEQFNILQDTLENFRK